MNIAGAAHVSKGHNTALSFNDTINAKYPEKPRTIQKLSVRFTLVSRVQQMSVINHKVDEELLLILKLR